MGSDAVPEGARLKVTLPSPNFGERRGGVRPSLIVLHYTAMPSCAEARARLCDPAAEVSAHWLIAEDGTAEQLVDEAARAWHAGAGGWGGISDVNSHSIGIELANPGDAPFPEPQMVVLERLLSQIMARWSIPPERIIGHCDMTPMRKRDPGPRFDWKRLARQGLSVWPDAIELPADVPGFSSADTIRDLGEALREFGYPVEDTATTPAIFLQVFQHRFRPGHRGFGPSDILLARHLARRFPVDAAATGS